MKRPDPGWDEPRQELSSDLLYAIGVSPDRKHVAVGGAEGKVLTGAVGGKWTPVHDHTAAVRDVAFSPDGKWLASVGLDGVLMLSQVGSKNPPRKILDHTAGIECLCFSPDSKFLASGAIDSRVRLHSVTDGKLVRTYTGLGMASEPVAGRVDSRVVSLVWAERLVAGTSKGTLHDLSLKDATSTRYRRRERSPISALAFTKEGNLVVGTLGKVVVWEKER